MRVINKTTEFTNTHGVLNIITIILMTQEQTLHSFTGVLLGLLYSFQTTTTIQTTIQLNIFSTNTAQLSKKLK